MTEDASISRAQPSWARPPHVPEPPPKRRVLYVCSTVAAACMGAIRQEKPGFAVVVSERDNALVVRWAESTVFGPIDKSRAFPDRAFIVGLVTDTLEAGEKDAWLCCIDGGITSAITDLVAQLGHDVKWVHEKISLVEDPFSLFKARRVRSLSADGGETQSFCELDAREHRPMVLGDEIRMACETDDSGTDIGYVDTDGWLVGMHGRLPYIVDDEFRQRIAEVRTTVSHFSWGRTWRGGVCVPVQNLIFDIPVDVDAMLADAKLVRELGGDNVS